MKEGQIYKIKPQIFELLPQDLVMIFQSLVIVLKSLSLTDLRKIGVSFRSFFIFPQLFFFFRFLHHRDQKFNDLPVENLQLASVPLWNPPVVPAWTLTSENLTLVKACPANLDRRFWVFALPLIVAPQNLQNQLTLTSEGALNCYGFER